MISRLSGRVYDLVSVETGCPNGRTSQKVFYIDLILQIHVLYMYREEIEDQLLGRLLVTLIYSSCSVVYWTLFVRLLDNI